MHEHCLIYYISITKKVINLYISFIADPQLKNLSTYFTLGNFLFESVKLTKNADIDKCKYSGFDSRSEFSLSDGSMGKKVIIFGADMSSSVHVDNKEKDILIIDEGPTQRFDDITLTTEAKHPINFTIRKKNSIKSTLSWEQQSLIY